MKKIKLKTVLGKSIYTNNGGYGKHQVLIAMKKVCELILIRASENATVVVDENNNTVVDKQSILQTINEIEL